MSYLSESGGSGLRDGQDRKRKVEYVGVGFPNPLGEENSPHDGYRAANCAAFSPRGATCASHSGEATWLFLVRVEI